MISERRLAKIESSLTPTEAVLRWLAEAQQCRSLVDYAGSIVDLPEAAAPLSRVCHDVEAAVRGGLRGQPRSAIDAAVRRSVGDAVFLYALIIRLNTAAHELSRLHGLRAAALGLWPAALLEAGVDVHDDQPGRAQELDAGWQRWRAILASLLGEVRVEGEARRSLERRYLGGHPNLFDAEAGEWAGLEEHVEHLAKLAALLPPGHPGGGTSAEPGASAGSGDDIRDVVASRARSLADDARVRAFELLGDRARAVAIMAQRLRAEPAP